MFCPNCGKKIPNDSKTCNHCGEVFEQLQTKRDIDTRQANVSAVSINNTGSVVKIVFGIIFFVGGLVSLLSRGELMVEIVGRNQMMRESLFGGSSASDTLTAIMVISSIAMIIGLALSVWGFVKIQKTNH
jgi:predicted nucleic acid-binding Zn ribbon protein